jgi:hypothetical protein
MVLDAQGLPGRQARGVGDLVVEGEGLYGRCITAGERVERIARFDFHNLHSGSFQGKE